MALNADRIWENGNNLLWPVFEMIQDTVER